MPVKNLYALVATQSRAAVVATLAQRHGRVQLDGVLDDLDRAAVPCAVPGEAAGAGFTWDETDRHDRSWWPQGVAALGGGDILLVSWYRKRHGLRSGATRVSVVDRRSPDAPRYRHVRLVAPRRRFGVPVLRPVPVHAGGIAVFGGLLYVADTLFGVRVFRLADVMRAGRGWWTGGEGYVLPQLTSVRVPLRAGRRRLRHSFLSVGEADGRPVLVVGEYRRTSGGPPRLARYPLDPATGLPATEGRFVAPLDVHVRQPPRMQGAAVHGTTWYLSASAGEGVPGDLYVGSPVGWTRHRGVLPPGPEDLAWSRPGEELWCVSEWPGRRWVFPVDTGRWTDGAGQDPAVS